MKTCWPGWTGRRLWIYIYRRWWYSTYVVVVVVVVDRCNINKRDQRKGGGLLREEDFSRTGPLRWAGTARGNELPKTFSFITNGDFGSSRMAPSFIYYSLHISFFLPLADFFFFNSYYSGDLRAHKIGAPVTWFFFKLNLFFILFKNIQLHCLVIQNKSGRSWFEWTTPDKVSIFKLIRRYIQYPNKVMDYFFYSIEENNVNNMI